MAVEILSRMFAPIKIPKMVKVRQKFADSCIRDIGERIREELLRREIREKIRRGEDVSDLVPAAALEIAGQYGLYREAQE